MREEIESHKLIASFIAGWLAIFLFVWFYLGAYQAQARVEAEVIMVFSLTVCSALGLVGLGEIILAVQFGAPHLRELITYTSLGLISVASSLILSLTSHLSLPLISVFLAPHALLFGLAEIRIANGLAHHRLQARSLMFCGMLELGCGILLAAGYFLSDTQVVSLFGVTAIATLLQLLPFLFFSPKCLHMSKEIADTGFPRRKG